MTKCTMNLYGASGTLQNYDALCVMPVNMLNEKVTKFIIFFSSFFKEIYLCEFFQRDNIIFLFVGLTTLGTFIKFKLVGLSS